MLRTLEAEGLIHQVEDNERKSYELTSSGHDELRQWIAEEPDMLPVQRNELLLKLFFARHETMEQPISKITHHERLLRERLETYKAIETMYVNLPNRGLGKALGVMDVGKGRDSAKERLGERSLHNPKQRTDA